MWGKKGYFHFVLRIEIVLYKSFSNKGFHIVLLKINISILVEMLTPSAIKSYLLENDGPAFLLINY